MSQTSYPNPGGGEQPTLGRYVLVREIARSNDIVWEGLDPKMNRRVAVKELQLGQHLTGTARRDRIERFYREARAAGKLNHPNIVTIYESGEDHGRYFIAMEYLEGQTLRNRMSVGGPMSLGEAVAITRDLADALQYAHERGVVHRDIKPDNVHLLPGGRVKLTDFGIARIQSEEQLTVAGQVFGTPSYMSPEQVLGRPIDARSDLFSLGVMLYEMVTGRKPFTGDSVATITYQIVNEATPPITTGSPALEEVIQRATAKDPAMRFPSAAAFRAALDAAEALHRTGGYRAAPQYAPPPAPAAYPPAGGYGAVPAATAQYGTQTQFGIAPGYAAGAAGMPPPQTAAPTPAYAADPNAVRGGGNGGRIAAILATVVIVGLCFTLLAFGISKALKTASADQQRNAADAKLAHAQELYSKGMYQDAADEADKVGAASGDEHTKTLAAQTEAYSLLQLGQAAMNQRDYATAETDYNQAAALLPDDASVKDHLRLLEQAKQYKAAGSYQPQAPRSAGPMPGFVPGPNPTIIPSATPPPWRIENAQGFAQANQAAAQQAQQLLSEGQQLYQQGDRNGARAKWQQAVEVGTGSTAAQQANDLLTKTAPSYQ